MSFGDKVRQCSRSNTVRILLLLLLILLIVVGAIWYFNSSDDEAPPRSLKIVPHIGNDSLIQFKSSDRQSVRVVTRAIEESLESYNATNDNIYTGCNFLNPPPLGKTCNVDLTTFSPCVKSNNFGYTEGRPCVFLQLSRSVDWVPQFYNKDQLPESMPEYLKFDIEKLTAASPRNSNMIWLSCAGKTPADEKIVGSINLYPRSGFPGFYYPCTSEVACTEPLVALQFARPARNVTINIECKIWAVNLQESVDFQLLLN